MSWRKSEDLKGYEIVRINEGQLQFAVKKGNTVYNKFMTEESARHWIRTVG